MALCVLGELMSFPTAGQLLRTMQIRLSLYEDGITNPSASGRRAIRLLVEKLSCISPTEEIAIEVHQEQPLFATYVRRATGEVLAEVEEANGEQLT